MTSQAPKVRIIGTGRYAPARICTNADLEKMVDTTDAWITERTGIKERHIAAPGELTSDMAAAASMRAIEMAGVQPTDIDMIIVGTISGDVQMPATATFVQEKIGARACPAFDLSAACAGFIYGLSIGEKFVATGAARYVLVVGVELLSRVLDWTDRTTCVLFGDGAGAVVLGPSDGDGRGIRSTRLYAAGKHASSLIIPGGGSKHPPSAETVEKRLHFVKMNGPDIFKAAVKYLCSSAKLAVDELGLQPEQIDWVVPHQANLRILDQVSQRIGVPMSRFYLNIDRYGNTSSASVPMALDEAVRNGLITQGQTLLFCALGAGVSWGTAVVVW
jgi:3-oxoacyl-[acyl-carrier-protein] synthase III